MAETSSLSFLAVQVFTGLTLGMFLFIIAAGLTIIFGVLGIVNFAHGSLYMLGAYLGFYVSQAFSPSPAAFWLALLVAPLVVAFFGGAVEVLFLRKIYSRESSYQLLLTYSLVLIIDDLVKFVWGTDFKSPIKPPVLSGSVSILGGDVPSYYIFVLLLGVVLIALLYFVLYRTRWGRIIRAAAGDREMVACLGIDSRTLYTVIFMLGAWLGGLGGALAGPVRTVFPGVGTEIIIEAFIVVVVGGLGSIPGALVAALLLGELKSLGILIAPSMEMVFPFLLMALVLTIRPRGLLGRDYS